MCGYPILRWPLITRANMQGFQVSDDEINMDLATFRAHYASQTGTVE